MEKKGIISVVMHKNATTSDVLQSFIHALVMANIVEKDKDAHFESQSWMNKHYKDLLKKVLLNVYLVIQSLFLLHLTWSIPDDTIPD